LVSVVAITGSQGKKMVVPCKKPNCPRYSLMKGTMIRSKPFRKETIMNTATSLLVDDLAAHWTEPALEILKAAGFGPISVDMEVETWRALQEVLRSELRWQRAFRLSTLVSLSTVMEQVLRKATLIAARIFEPQAVSSEFKTRIRRLAGDRRSTLAERRLYAEIARQPGLRAAFKPPSRTDFTPRLRVSVLGG
jgi:hypothetical protein